MNLGEKGQGSKRALMGIFIYLDDLLAAIKALKGNGRELTVFSPSASEEIKEVLKESPSPVRYYTLFGGLFGLFFGFSLAVYTVLQWKFIVSGKPIIPWIPFVIVGFEFLILFGVVISFVGMLIHSRLPRRRLPVYYDPRFSDDRFGLLVYAAKLKGKKSPVSSRRPAPRRSMTSRDEIFREIKAAGPQAGFGSWTFFSLSLTVIGGVAFWIGISGSQAERVWQVFLVNYLFWSGLAFGSVLFSAALVITKARWGRPIKRLAEAPAAFLPFSFLLFWVLYLGRNKLFPWIREPLPLKAAWLNTSFLFARDGVSLFLLTAVSLALVYFSIRGEREIYSQGIGAWEGTRDQGEKNLHKQSILSPILAILFVLGFSLIGFDLVMSLSPHWYSTLFGMYFFTGAFYSGLAVLMVLSVLLV